MKNKFAVIMPSIGNRKWAEASAKTFEKYCERVGADFFRLTEYPSFTEFPLEEMPNNPGRSNKRAYACKAYFPWFYLEKKGYQKVLVVDDSCLIRADAPNIFDLPPDGACGFTQTSGLHAKLSFEVIQEMLDCKNLPEIEFDKEHYMNSGVMLYHHSHKDALSPEKIIAAAVLLYARFPHQTLSYYLLKRAGVPMHVLPKVFNTIPGVHLERDERKSLEDIKPFLKDEVYIFHLTNLFSNRPLLVGQIAEVLGVE